jgi:hypothetical protein
MGLAVLLLLVAAILSGIGLAGVQPLDRFISAAICGGLGLVGLILSLMAYRRGQIRVELDRHGYSITGPSGERTGAWTDVSRVALSRHKDKLALYHGEQRRTIIAHPAGQSDNDFLRLYQEIQQAVDQVPPRARIHLLAPAVH